MYLELRGQCGTVAGKPSVREAGSLVSTVKGGRERAAVRSISKRTW